MVEVFLDRIDGKFSHVIIITMNILMTGANGLVGSRLVRRLANRGDTVTAIVRRTVQDAFPPSVRVAVADIFDSETWAKLLPDADAVVHLAGENIFARRWSRAFRDALWASRVRSTIALSAALAAHPKRVDGSPKIVVSASAVGLYGDRGDEELTEESAPGTGFLAELGEAWEAAAQSARNAGVRVVHPRLGIVLDPNGGAVPNLVRPFKLFVGGPISHGRQYVSWIHHADLTNLLTHCLDNPTLTGPVNAVAPQPLTNAELSRVLASILRRPNWLSAPRWGLRVALGEVAQVVVSSQRAIPNRAMSAGFTFRWPTFREAMVEVLGK
jgi:uncharacterized protein